MRGLAVGGPGLVAVGWSGSWDDAVAAVWTSPDGVTWSRVPDDGRASDGAWNGQMWAVTAGGSGLVAVGYDGLDGDFDAAFWTSSDGVTWSRVRDDGRASDGAWNGQMWAVTAGGPGLVAVGSARPGEDSDAAVWVTSTEY